nr:DUF3575 domain-containing protein [Brumimicrobium aurantiacum]
MHNIYTNPVQYIMTDININYDRRISENWSGSIGIGMTYGRTLNKILNDNYGANYNNSISGTKLGLSLLAGFKFYTKEVFDGFYFGFDFKTRRYRESGSKYLTKETIFIPGVKIGYDMVLSDNFYFGYAFGAGARLVFSEAQPHNFDQPYNKEITFMTLDEGMPCFIGGINIGYIF